MKQHQLLYSSFDKPKSFKVPINQLNALPKINKENGFSLTPSLKPERLFLSPCRRKRRSTCSRWTTWSCATWRKASCLANTSSPSSTLSKGATTHTHVFIPVQANSVEVLCDQAWMCEINLMCPSGEGHKQGFVKGDNRKTCFWPTSKIVSLFFNHLLLVELLLPGVARVRMKLIYSGSIGEIQKNKSL